jgi:hypothetical protein
MEVLMIFRKFNRISIVIGVLTSFQVLSAGEGIKLFHFCANAQKGVTFMETRFPFLPNVQNKTLLLGAVCPSNSNQWWPYLSLQKQVNKDDPEFIEIIEMKKVWPTDDLGMPGVDCCIEKGCITLKNHQTNRSYLLTKLLKQYIRSLTNQGLPSLQVNALLSPRYSKAVITNALLSADFSGYGDALSDPIFSSFSNDALIAITPTNDHKHYCITVADKTENSRVKNIVVFRLKNDVLSYILNQVVPQ